MTRQFYQGRTRFNVAQRKRLLAALPPESELARRMATCGNLSQDTHGYILRCKAPACPSCRSLHATRNRRQVQEGFAGATHAHTAHITVVFDVLTQLGDPTGGELDEAVAKARRDLRNLVDRLRARDRRWRDFSITGWLEVDAIDGADLPLIGDERRQLLSDLGAHAGTAVTPLWVPTMHAVARFDHLPWQEVRDAFEHQWPLDRQVQVESFRPHLSIDENVENLVAYALKHRCTTNLSGTQHPWPAQWMAEFYLWLEQWSGSLKRTRIKIGKQAERPLHAQHHPLNEMDEYEEEEYDNDEYDEPLPFAFNFSVFPSLL